MVYEQNSPDLRSPEVSISVQVDCLLFFKKARLLATGMGGVTINLGISGWGCAAGTLKPLTYTRASSAEFCYPILE